MALVERLDALVDQKLSDGHSLTLFLLGLLVELLCDQVGPVHVGLEGQGRVGQVTCMDHHFGHLSLMTRY